MKRLTFSMPGKIGDALLQWPVAYHYARERNSTFDLWLDEKTLKPLVPLFLSQPCVTDCITAPGIEHWQCGGQPWDFGLKTEDHLEREFVHLGMREFPQRQITLQTLENARFDLEREPLSQEPSIFVRDPMTANRVVLHGTFTTHSSGTPGFWKLIHRIQSELKEMFEEIVFVGDPEERKRALEIYPDAKDFDDQGDFYRLAQLIAGSRLVIGAGSSVVALAGTLKIPCVRVHDEIGNHPRVLWSNLGPGQINETELELRKGRWEEFKDKHFQPKVIA